MDTNRLKGILIFATFFLFSITCSSQNEGLLKSFCKIGIAEKIWAISHPFIAKKTWEITKDTRIVATQMIGDTSLDSDADGGQVDAFRHVFWMASLSQQINFKKAQKLGIAHEKTNYRNFKKGKSEEKYLPDKKSSEMDLRNNDVGISLGCSHKKISKDSLIILVKQFVKNGKTWIISKNKKGESLDSNNNILPKEKYLKKWENSRCLVNSDKKRPK